MPRPAVTVLHVDEHLLVVDKPAGLLSVGGRPNEPTVAAALRERGTVPPAEAFRVVHRLDRDASGVLVFARTLAAQRHLTAQFAERTVEKVYLALVQGFVAEPAGRIDLPLRNDADGTRASPDPRGKPALTEYRVVERVAGHTLLECRPRTGRLHQIRVHLAHLGHPVAADPLYGGGRAVLLSAFKPGYRPNRRGEERPLIGRLALHAARIAFEHPGGRGPVTFEAPLPRDLRAALRQLRKLV